MTRIAVLVGLVTALCAGLATPAATAATATTRSVLKPATVVKPGLVLRSPNGAYTASLRRGHLVVRHGTQVVWSTSPHARNARLVLRHSGNLVVRSGRHIVWSTNTRHAKRLVLRNNGVLALRSAGGTVWSNRVHNRCLDANGGMRVVVDLSTQFARLCNGRVQVLTTPITSGMSAYGYGTPTGTWRVQAKERERYLYPASGGAYYVHYWIPYDGVYGMHDSSWQKFPYGSPRYRTEGSHGCVHFPLAAIRWMNDWLRIGTVVRIHS